MSEIRIAIVGAGLMGADHVARIENRIIGARVSAIVEPDEGRAQSAMRLAPGATLYLGLDDAIAANGMDAVLIATPGKFHEPALLSAVSAKLPTLCEKPLTPDAASALRVVKAEVEGGLQLIQVGFMRRFDSGYRQLRDLITSKKQGDLLGMHCAHRNPDVPESYTTDFLIFDSLVHEIDIVRYLTDSPIKSVQIRKMKRNSRNHANLTDPILVLLETQNEVLASVELNVSVKFGYQVKTEAIFEMGIAEIGRTSGMTTFFDGAISTQEHASFKTRFADAYDSQIQSWVNAIQQGKQDGPSAWDGYLAAATVEAGLQANLTGECVNVRYETKPSFYN